LHLHFNEIGIVNDKLEEREDILLTLRFILLDLFIDFDNWISL